MAKKKYTASSITTLDATEHIRLRPSIYFGDNRYNGILNMLQEVLFELYVPYTQLTFQDLGNQEYSITLDVSINARSEKWGKDSFIDINRIAQRFGGWEFIFITALSEKCTYFLEDCTVTFNKSVIQKIIEKKNSQPFKLIFKLDSEVLCCTNFTNKSVKAILKRLALFKYGKKFIYKTNESEEIYYYEKPLLIFDEVYKNEILIDEPFILEIENGEFKENIIIGFRKGSTSLVKTFWSVRGIEFSENGTHHLGTMKAIESIIKKRKLNIPETIKPVILYIFNGKSDHWSFTYLDYEYRNPLSINNDNFEKLFYKEVSKQLGENLEFLKLLKFISLNK